MEELVIVPEDYKSLYEKFGKRSIDYRDPEFLLTNDVEAFSKEIFYTEAAREILNTQCKCTYPPDQLFTIGMTCPECGEVIKKANPIGRQHECWIVIDELLPPIIAPGAFRTLDPWFGKHKIPGEGRRGSMSIPLLELFITPNSEKLIPEDFEGIPTGLFSFHKNFDKIVEIMLKSYKNSKKYRAKNEEILEYIQKFRDRIFTRHIPMLDRRAHLLQEIADKIRTDQSANMVIAMILGVGSAYRAITRDGGKKYHAERHLLSCQRQVNEYSTHLLKKKQFKKAGHIHKYLNGARMHFTLRALITPSPKMIPPDEIELPWTGAVTLYRLELLNHLTKRKKMNLADAYDLTVRSEFIYNKTIDEIFKTLISECTYSGLPALVDRNPSLNLMARTVVMQMRLNTFNCWNPLRANLTTT